MLRDASVARQEADRWRIAFIAIKIPAPATIAAGNRLQLEPAYTTSPAGGPSSATRMLYGGARYGDSGVTLTFGSLQ